MKLSIGIPTYNRGEFIGETLRSILPQATDSLEIVVCDNASTDDTAAIIAEFQKKFLGLIYFRWETNVGADRNFLKVVELSTGDYCWLMSSDDIVEPNGINIVLNTLEKYEGLSGISVNGFTYTKDMKTRTGETIQVANKIKSDYLFSDVDDAFSTLGEYFGYLSGQIVNRTLWNQVITANDLAPYYISYIHLFIIAKMVSIKPYWYFLSQKCVGWRGDNDSFLIEGKFKRLQIDVLGFEKIYRDVSGRSSKGYREVMKTVSSVYVRHMMLSAKLQGAAPASFYLKSLALTVRTYWRYPVFWLKTFPIFVLPRFILLLARTVYRALRKLRTLEV